MHRLTSTAVAASLFLAGLATAAPVLAQAPAKVRLTIPVTALSMTPVYLAQARGFFTAEGLEVTTTMTGGSGPDIRALIAGEVDFTFTPGDNVLLAFPEGKRLVMVMSGLNRLFINWAMHRDVARERGITSATPLPEKLKALKGLTVGVTTPGALTAHLAAFVIRKAGYVPQQDVKILPVGAGPTWLAALENRKVDVALTATPTPETAILRGYAIMFIDNAQGEDPSFTEFLMASLITRPDVIEKSPELVRRMVRALVRANQWARGASADEVAAALRPTFAQTDPAIHLAGVKAVLPALNASWRTTERSFEATHDVLDQAGLLKNRAGFTDVVNNDFVPR
jgi:NitT/TauT family transport system substrate-binding protein